MEKESANKIEDSSEQEFKIVDGKKYKKVPSGYTVRQYYSHSTPEKGPGPGWDMFRSAKDIIAEDYGIKLKGKDLINFKPEDLPDEPHFTWQEVPEE